MNLEYIVPNEANTVQKRNTAWSHLYVQSEKVTFIEVSGFCFPGTTHRTLYLDLSGVFEAQFCSQKQSPDFSQFDYLLFKCTANFMFVKLAYGFRDIVWTYFWFPYPLSTCNREPKFSYVNSILSSLSFQSKVCSSAVCHSD